MKNRLLALLVMLPLLIATLGCDRRPSGGPASPSAEAVSTGASLPAAAVEPSISTEPTAAEKPADGPALAGRKHGIVEPARGGLERKALMDAARRRLKTGAQFEVGQLMSDGVWAVGRLKPTDGAPEQWVAWRNQAAGGWTAIWNGTSAERVKGEVVTADPRFPGDVLGRVDLSLAPSHSELIAGVKSAVGRNVPKGEVIVLAIEKTARDGSGRLWVRARYRLDWWEADDEDVIVVRDGTEWRYEIGGSSIPAEDLPADVRSLGD